VHVARPIYVINYNVGNRVGRPRYASILYIMFYGFCQPHGDSTNKPVFLY